MRIIYFIVAVLLFILSACAQSGGAVGYVDTPAEGVPVCGELDGEKQTFPSIEELSNISGASYLHDGPCYE